ncbi:MAG: carboxypeptidase-like regulatory domain-containing protein [Proteiniphilum sp.]|jgi:hypothetical protein|nr:carboxypeptidase-like regulatory domain-containing protein [Proteiniphilum sp.]MDD3956955.1 carboxypeptidase-like regulatory domain-containing protein [Proteiniphilum sp.]MDD4453312.1 carboxypeptidase-like regulatory domain-containing protein [Proteiniphilum sp.]
MSRIEEENLKEYIQGNRHGKKANQLERQTMDDPFLRDAIDGFDSVEGDHSSVIEKLEKRIQPTQKRIHKSLWIGVAAAVLILLIGIPLLLLPPGAKEEVVVATSESIPQTKEAAPTAAPKDPGIVEMNPVQEAPVVLPPATKEEKVVSNNMVINIIVNEEVEVAAVSQDVTERSVPEGSKETDMALLARGRVVDETGEPIIGATIQLKNSNMGTVTDMEGKFSLHVPVNADSTLLALYVGMKPQEIPVKENVGDITLQSDDMALNEVIVVGFGTQKKSSVVGAVTRTDSIVKTSSSEETDSVTTNTNRAIFDKEEFTGYFRENYDEKICEGQSVSFVVTFFIDITGHPRNVQIKENSCPAMETEIKRLLLGSPPWSEGNRRVTLKIELK